MKKISIIFIFVFLFVAPSMTHVFAAAPATVQITVPVQIETGQIFSVLIAADTAGESINSADITLSFDSNLISFAGYKKEGSTIALWVTPPHEERDMVMMQGVIPGGVSGFYDPKSTVLAPIPIATLLFEAKVPGIANFSFTDSKLFKNDGKGTELAHTTTTASTKIIKASGTAPSESSDTVPPEPFTVTYLESSLFSRTPMLVAFSAIDNDSGIKNYDIRVGNGGWHPAHNPEPVRRALFSRTVTIRAYDFRDNYTDAHVRIPGLISYVFLAIILAVILSGFLVYKLIKYKA